jgi:histidinol dehydrogenase
MAFGTESIRPVAKVFGPGNRFVVEAKRQVVGTVAIDLLPGPSEIMVLADGSGDPRFIAADLLAQAEHGGDSQVVLVTDSEDLLTDVQSELRRQSKSLSRRAQVAAVLRHGCTLVLVRDLQDGAALANGYAPEHLTLISRRESSVLPLIRTAGAIFLGNYSPVAAGDFLAGPSHTLPTGGAGHSFPGLTADMFQRRTSIVRLGRDAARRSAPAIAAFSALEGLDAHGRSAQVRLSTRQLPGQAEPRSGRT